MLVDIAGFSVRVFRDNEVAWRSRVQVGRPYRATPVFRDRIRYLEFNPTWTVPPGILRKDVIPAVQRDASYLPDRDMSVLTSDGRSVDPASIDWSRYPKERFPYRIVQAPGPRNALGLVKFMFPNDHLVFLHDTPSRALFERTERGFSSGCIRVENPFALAELLLDDEAEWSRQQIDDVVASAEIRRVNLRQPLPVLLLYWTIDIEQPGRVGFNRDLYDRDAAVLEGLEGEFRVRKRPIAP